MEAAYSIDEAEVLRAIPDEGNQQPRVVIMALLLTSVSYC